MEVRRTPSSGPLKIINAGLFRTATRSMAAAYRILGYETHHALDNTDDLPWPLIEQAAEATWPHVPKAKARPPYTREDWDTLWGSYDAVTDIASPFAEELIKAYPEAKVVIVKRDFDTWWPSFRSELIDGLFQPSLQPLLFFATHVLRIRSLEAMRKIHFGIFNARSKAEIHAHAKEAYDAYYERIRKLVPAERRLEYKISDGWESLCQFLGKEVPDVPFPRVNERKDHAAMVADQKRALVLKLMAFTIGVVAVTAGIWAMRVRYV